MLRVLIVDDSTVYRSQIRAALSGVDNIEIVGFASNGRLAIDVLKSKPVDVMTLDLEMPEMNGLEVLAEMRRLNIKAKVIVFSAHSKAGAESALQALHAGAADVVAKPTLTSPDQSPSDLIRQHLLPKVQQFAVAPAVTAASVIAPTHFRKSELSRLLPQVLVIASSTGGPAALEKLFSLIAPPFLVPILIAQHMPPIFTATLAERLARICGAKVAEGQNLEAIQAGQVYIAPGDFHMRVKAEGGRALIQLDTTERRNFVRPAADHLFESASAHYKNACLGIVLTGMGADGKDGAVKIKENGGSVLIQNRESCVVFGMPGAVADAGAYDFVGDLEALAETLIQLRIASPPKIKGAAVS